eukprot:15355667-Ditylum_brightwellii.AAC.1
MRTRTNQAMIPMMSFILNPYDNALDLSDKDDRKLSKTRYKGLESAQRFDGRKESFNNFAKVVSHQIKKVRLTEALEIATDWDALMVAPRLPKMIVNIFKKKEVSKDTLKAHMDLVWANMGYGGVTGETPNYFKAKIPTDTPALNVLRNQRKLKHVMLGNMIWDSPTSNFQIELMAKQASFKQGNNFDDILLWYHIVNQVNPLTKAAIRNLKDKLESAKLDNLGKT